MSRNLSIILPLALLLLIGCSKPPVTEMQNAEAAIKAATDAEVEKYAPEAYHKAVEALNTAKSAKEEQDAKFALLRNYDKVKADFASAQTLAEDATTMAESARERVKSEVTELMTGAQAALDEAEKAVETAPRGKGSKADLEMIKNDLASVKTAFEDAKADFDAQAYLPAKTKLQTVLGNAKRITAEIEAARMKKAGK